MRAGKPVRSYTRGGGVGMTPDGIKYKTRSGLNITARNMLNEGDHTFRETGHIMGGIKRARAILGLAKRHSPEQNADAPMGKITKRQLDMYSAKNKHFKEDKKRFVNSLVTKRK